MSNGNEEGAPKRRMRVMLHQKNVDYIHNDISSVAYYFKKRIVERMEADDHDDLFLEMMASLTMTAFAVEANLNFVGAKVVNGWKEKQSSAKKFQQVLETLDIKEDNKKRPFSTVLKLRIFRDALAHGKPRIFEKEEEAVGTFDELYALQENLKRSDWEEFVTVEFVVDAFDDMKTIWRMMCDQANINIADTLGGSSGGMTFIEHVDEPS